jgi:beta-glucosidase
LGHHLTFQDIDYTEGLYIDYRWFDKQEIEPIYEFGYGLSYTTFKMTYLDIAVTGDPLNADEPGNSKKLYDVVAWVNVDVCNTGDVFGTEIAQLYIGSPAEGAPLKVLRGFEAAHLHPGETKRVTFELTRRDLR